MEATGEDPDEPDSLQIIRYRIYTIGGIDMFADRIIFGCAGQCVLPFPNHGTNPMYKKGNIFYAWDEEVSLLTLIGLKSDEEKILKIIIRLREANMIRKEENF
ncbi:hypothetical protein L0Y49_04975 [bacterium]|nr:hypothetical protein [bacterium]MCI0566160.1 hypothetical protein [bacterium]MCI0679999.1 hypothetical protein [bacterium]